MVAGLSAAAPDGLLHADTALVVVVKPAGLLSVPGRGQDKQDCMARRVQAEYPDALVVHRLDMATSGLFLMARGPANQRDLSTAFESRRVDKRYIAVVAGTPEAVVDAEGWATIDLPLAADWPNRPRQAVDGGGRPSQTRWRVIGPGPLPGTMRLLLQPVTGRTHQLRVHLQAIGHPVVGDALYAPQDIAAASDRLLLHATQLALDHPSTGLRMQWSSPAPF